MKKMIDELWDGEISPQDTLISDNQEYRELQHRQNRRSASFCGYGNRAVHPVRAERLHISGAVSVLSAPVCLGVGSDRQAGCRSPQCLGIGTLADQCSDSRNHLHADRRCSQFRNSDRCQRFFRWQIRRCGYQNFLRLCFSPRMVKRSDRSCARTPHRRTVYADL